jgi:hypothetical protein
MKLPELMKKLTSASGNSDLHEPVRAALNLINGSDHVEIHDHRDGPGQLRVEVLGAYEIRQKINADNGTAVEGLRESIACLAKEQAERLHLITAQVPAQTIGIWLAPSGEIVGCTLGEDKRKT